MRFGLESRRLGVISEPNVKPLATATLFNAAGNNVYGVALGWLAYEATGSPLAVGAVLGLRDALRWPHRGSSQRPLPPAIDPQALRPLVHGAVVRIHGSSLLRRRRSWPHAGLHVPRGRWVHVRSDGPAGDLRRLGEPLTRCGRPRPRQDYVRAWPSHHARGRRDNHQHAWAGDCVHHSVRPLLDDDHPRLPRIDAATFRGPRLQVAVPTEHRRRPGLRADAAGDSAHALRNLDTRSVRVRVSPGPCRQRRVAQRRGDRDRRDPGRWGCRRPGWASPAPRPEGTRQFLDGAGRGRDDDERGDGGFCLLSITCGSRGGIRCYGRHRASQ